MQKTSRNLADMDISVRSGVVRGAVAPRRSRGVRGGSVLSGVTKWVRGAVAPGRSRRGGAKQPHQKCFNNPKSEFDEVF